MPLPSPRRRRRLPPLLPPPSKRWLLLVRYSCRRCRGAALPTAYMARAAAMVRMRVTRCSLEDKLEAG